MTKYKEFMRSKGVMLNSDIAAMRSECDFEIDTCAGIEWDVSTEVMDDCVVAVTYSNITEPEYAVYNRYGECNYYNSLDYRAYVGDPHCDPKYIDFLFDTGCNKDLDVFDIMRFMYIDDAKVRIAFKHMQAGIMDFFAFYGWISDYYQKYINRYSY